MSLNRNSRGTLTIIRNKLLGMMPKNILPIIALSVFAVTTHSYVAFSATQLPPGLSAGLVANYFVLPATGVKRLSEINFTLTPTATVTVGSVNANSALTPFWTGGPIDDFAAQYTGALRVVQPGRYTIFLTSDDGSNLYLNGVKIIDNDGQHAAVTRQVTVDLTAGLHPIELVYFERKGRQTLRLEWQGPDSNGIRQVIADNSLVTKVPPNYAEAMLETVTDGVGVSDPSLAVGLTGYSYWKSPPFLNIMKQSAGPSIRNAQDQEVSLATLVSQGYLDENGYPMRMYEGNSTLASWKQGYNYIVSIHFESDFVRRETAGDYVVEWAGEGTIRLDGFSIRSQETLYAPDGTIAGGRMVGNWGYEDQLKYFRILATDPRGTGNYIRDVSIVRVEYADMYEAGAIFDPRYTTHIKDHHTIRYMDWMRTNGSDVQNIGDVAKLDTVTWAGPVNAGQTPNVSSVDVLPVPALIPFEVMVRLANETSTDPWFNIPLEANDEFVRALAAYVEANLDDGLSAKFELSNEVWNWAGGFEQTREASLLGSNGTTSSNIVPAREYYGYRSAQIKAILNEEMSRVDAELILGTQTVYYNMVSWAERGVTRYFAEKGTTGTMSDVFDSLAVTGYFGTIASNDFAALRQFWYTESQAAFAAGQTTTKYELFVKKAANYFANGIEGLTAQELSLMPKQANGTIRIEYIDPLEEDLRRHFATNKRMADAWGLELIQYEADSHVSPTNYQSDPNSEWYKALNKSPEMGQLTTRMAEIFREEGGTLVNDFGHLGDTSYGLWGTRAHMADENPISAAYDTYNRTAAARFGSLNTNRSPGVFLNGIVADGSPDMDIIVGTHKRDYLLGGAGNDFMVSGDGTDGLHGGDGIDIVLLAGNRSDYTVTKNDGMVVVTGPDGDKRLVDVELVGFVGDREFVRVSDLAGDTSTVEMPELLAPYLAVENVAGDIVREWTVK